ncbi:MAG: transporter ATP-binding protein [Microbacterium sp.]|jgi:ABC-type multidrug transport system fused ATPase/permease subunit|nr:transporter ATP-binding protein [Microbacterium sp.]
MRSIWRTLLDLFGVLPRDARPFYLWYSIATGLLSILDTAALALIVLTVNTLVTKKPIEIPLLGPVPESATVWMVLTIAVLFIVKGVLAATLHWRATRRFARYELDLGDRLFAAYTHSSWEDRSRISTAELTRFVDSSVGSANRGFLLPLSQVPGNLFTFLAALLILVIAQPLTALIAFVYLSLVSGAISLMLSRRSKSEGQRSRDYSYRVATVMTEMVEALKEVTLRGKLDEAGRVISKNRAVATRSRANLAFMTIVPRYAFEAALIGGFLLIGASGFLTGGAPAAVVAVSLFAASGFRMIPSMNAVQASLTAASSNEVYAKDVIRHLSETSTTIQTEERDTEELPEHPSELRLRNVSFSYAGDQEPVLKELDLSVPFGSSLAIVGPSGAGKSTLIDVILGLSVPTSGTLEIDGHPVDRVLQQWRTRVGYVPQRVALFDGSVAQNVALTWEKDYDEDRVVQALRRAHISEIAQRPGGLEERLGERGSSVSGGQQQRLGIARALYTDPLVMVMDEATSSLDTATENRVVESMNELRGQVTFITVAHRLATIRHYDQVCYLDEGRIKGFGTFQEVVEQVPDFRFQASLAGLVQ